MGIRGTHDRRQQWIASIDAIADPDRLRQLDLALLPE
jgi:hypothetical protein